MLGIQAIPSVLLLWFLKYVPESPRWLIIKKGEVTQALKIFKTINPATSEKTVSEILEKDKKEKQIKQDDFLFSKRYKTPIILAVLFALFNQVSGINAIIYYSPRIFEMTGLEKNSSLLSTVGIGIVNFSFTLLAVNFIDRIGRRTLMMIGTFGLIITLAMVSYSFYTADFNGWAVPILLFIYIAFFAFSQGAVIWVFISEIFPNQARAERTNHWQCDSLDHGNNHRFFISLACRQSGGWQHLPFLLFHDVHAINFCVEGDA